MPSESCPYCGEMTTMKLDLTSKTWVSTECEHCGKNLADVAASVPELVDDKPDLKAAKEVLP